ncbi:hypothetical protein BDN71DRAFT_426906 [Pleurotus eryngii]|uniref:Transmembrane protein n=1 Tax=Pleurotus eryngii TaxID=5323 RepID=A0A9P6DAH7_PLEER|nr:hypothetical protein BDN71DRAFT_426906 [Pleurotus eryngii]
MRMRTQARAHEHKDGRRKGTKRNERENKEGRRGTTANGERTKKDKGQRRLQLRREPAARGYALLAPAFVVVASSSLVSTYMLCEGARVCGARSVKGAVLWEELALRREWEARRSKRDEVKGKERTWEAKRTQPDEENDSVRKREETIRRRNGAQNGYSEGDAYKRTNERVG